MDTNKIILIDNEGNEEEFYIELTRTDGCIPEISGSYWKAGILK